LPLLATGNWQLATFLKCSPSGSYMRWQPSSKQRRSLRRLFQLVPGPAVEEGAPGIDPDLLAHGLGSLGSWRWQIKFGKVKKFGKLRHRRKGESLSLTIFP
jgi:hypothetical protein